jgi:hypothetical protein
MENPLRSCGRPGRAGLGQKAPWDGSVATPWSKLLIMKIIALGRPIVKRKPPGSHRPQRYAAKGREVRGGQIAPAARLKGVGAALIGGWHKLCFTRNVVSRPRNATVTCNDRVTTEMIAIPVMRGRVAPVLNWCSQMLLFPAKPEGAGQELQLPELAPRERLKFLRDQGVNTLVCGALSTDLHDCAIHLGFRVVCGIAGGVGEVLEAYRENRLDGPEFRLPGCGGARWYRQGLGKKDCPSCSQGKGGGSAMPGGRSGKGTGRGQGRGAGGSCSGAGGGPGPAAGPGLTCVCQACGAKAPHERGIPCLQVACPQCGKPMVRE